MSLHSPGQAFRAALAKENPLQIVLRLLLDCQPCSVGPNGPGIRLSIFLAAA